MPPDPAELLARDPDSQAVPFQSGWPGQIQS
jgi:hypothetical protein